jgi:putative zinc finger/helix-turn-helix YgiT family protein
MNIIKCPFCGSEKVALKREPTKIFFRNEEFKVYKLFYECESCKERFTDTRLDERNLQQVKNQYREIHSIPSSEQLVRTREKYGLSAAKMSAILGFGANIYRNYEKGEVPNLSNGTLLNIAIQPEEFQKIIENHFCPK